MRRSDIEKAIYEGWRVRDLTTGKVGVVDGWMNSLRLFVRDDAGKRFQAHFTKLQPLGEATRRF